ncbi:MAG: ADP-glyceromanno-heptose 6-epimerase [Bacteroidales bacterium]
MIVITGAAGFIGSCFVSKLNKETHRDLILVDDFSNPLKNKNLENKFFYQKIDREIFIDWFKDNYQGISFVVHLGARTDTTEFDVEVFNKLNLNYSKDIWRICTDYCIPLIYASSAATYGGGEHGYDDDHSIIPRLKPLNPYGESKNEFDKWVLKQNRRPSFWAGFKFFNVYGPNEYHKNRMASVVLHAYNQIKETGTMKLFKSHNPNYKDGEQLRDFIYVKDVVDVLFFMMEKRENPGIYNLGTGKASSFLDLANSVFKALDKEPSIEFINTPKDIRNKYQYFTEAKMTKLRDAGYDDSFYSIEEGVNEYVKEYLVNGKYY